MVTPVKLTLSVEADSLEKLERLVEQAIWELRQSWAADARGGGEGAGHQAGTLGSYDFRYGRSAAISATPASSPESASRTPAPVDAVPAAVAEPAPTPARRTEPAAIRGVPKAAESTPPPRIVAKVSEAPVEAPAIRQLSPDSFPKWDINDKVLVNDPMNTSVRSAEVIDRRLRENSTHNGTVWEYEVRDQKQRVWVPEEALAPNRQKGS